MCEQARQASLEGIIENLRQPMPLGRKVRLVARNTWLKIRRRSTCCGNYGEPGC